MSPPLPGIGGGSVLSVPLTDFPIQLARSYAVNGIPLPTQPYIATAPAIQANSVPAGSPFVLLFANPDALTQALLANGTVMTLQFLLASGIAISTLVQIASSYTAPTFHVQATTLATTSTQRASLPFLISKDGITFMTANVFGRLPTDLSSLPAAGVYDPVTHAVVAVQAGTTATDGTNSVVYAPFLATTAPGSSTAINDGVTTSTKASVGQTHNANNQVLSNVNSLFTSGVSQIVTPIGTGNQQLEVSFDNAPSHGIISGASNLAQTQSSTATGAITQGQTTNATITPTTMTSGMVQFQEVDIDLGTANQEPGYIVSVTSTTITVQPVNGSPATPSWKNAHSGTYKIQVRAYNVMRDAKGENSGADGTGTNLALEYEWASGGPVLASGIPSLNQYDRETLIVGQGLQSQAITSTSAGATSITMTSAVGTLTPGHPIRLSGGSVPETVYVDQSYVPGSNTAIPLKSPVVNASQTLATWQVYATNGPGNSAFLLYGEGMEGIVLNDMGHAGQGYMMQANSDNLSIFTSQSFGIGTTNSNLQINPNAKGLNVFLNVTAIGTGTIQLAVQGQDPQLGVYYTIFLDAFAITANGFYTFILYPGSTPIASTSGTAPGTGVIRTAVSQPLPKSWRVQVIVATAAVTAQVDAGLIL